MKAIAKAATEKTTIVTDRYRRFMGGDTPEDIAAADGVSLIVVQRNIRQGGQIESLRNAEKVMRLKEKAVVAQEELRAEIRKSVGEQVTAAIATLLRGKRPVVQTDKETGIVTVIDIDDPEVLALGLQEFRATTSHNEKPGPAVAIAITNNTQNNVSAGGWDFEEQLDKIRAAQDAAEFEPDDRVLDVVPEPEESTTPPVATVDLGF